MAETDDERPRPILRTSRQNTVEAGEVVVEEHQTAGTPTRNVRFMAEEEVAEVQHFPTGHVSQKDLSELEGVRLLRETSLRRRERLLNPKTLPKGGDDLDIDALIEDEPPSPNPNRPNTDK